MTIPTYIDPEDFEPSEAVWQFCTPRFRVVLFAEPEDMDPADSFSDERDIEAVRLGAVEWFSATVIVYGPDGEVWGRDDLGGCAYKSLREFYSSHRWQYSRRQDRWITDPKSRAWKACEARRPRRADGSRMDGGYFTDMVRTALGEARATALRLQHVAREG